MIEDNQQGAGGYSHHRVQRGAVERGLASFFNGSASPVEDSLVCAVSALRCRGSSDDKQTPRPGPWWIITTLILRDYPAGIGTKRIAPVAGLLRAVSLHHSR